MKKPVESTSETNWSRLPEEWKNLAVDSIVEAGLGNTTMATVAVITSALYEAFGENKPVVIRGKVQEKYSTIPKPGYCSCIQDDSYSWLNCYVHRGE